MAGAPFRRSVTRITPFPSRRLLTSTSKRHAGASCAIFICRCPVSTDMPAVCQYTPLRFPRPCASSGGATLCSMYCHTAGKEITSGGWRSLFPDPIRTHRLFCHAACRNSRASGTPGRRGLLVPLVVSCPQPCRTTAPQLPKERHGSPVGIHVFRFRSTSSDSIPRRLRLRARAPLFGVPHSSPTRALQLPSS